MDFFSVGVSPEDPSVIWDPQSFLHVFMIFVNLVPHVGNSLSVSSRSFPEFV